MHAPTSTTKNLEKKHQMALPPQLAISNCKLTGSAAETRHCGTNCKYQSAGGTLM
jgi:hypothetical protein